MSKAPVDMPRVAVGVHGERAMNLLSKVAVFALALSLVACDPQYPLTIHNGLNVPVSIEAKWTGGYTNTGTLKPGESLGFMHTKGVIDRLIVSAEGRNLYDLDQNKLKELAESVDDMYKVSWSFEKNGIRPIPNEKFRSEKHQLDVR